MIIDATGRHELAAFLRDVAARIENEVATNLSFSIENEIVDVGDDGSMFVNQAYSGRRTITLSYVDKSAFQPRTKQEADDGTTTQ